MSLMSASRSYDLIQDATTKVISAPEASQKEGFVNGLIAEATGAFNGGMTGSIGLSHTVFTAGVPLAVAALQKKQLVGAWGVPFLKA